MRNKNLALRRNVRNDKQALVESIMNKIAPIVKNALNEYGDFKLRPTVFNGLKIYEIEETINNIFNKILLSNFNISVTKHSIVISGYYDISYMKYEAIYDLIEEKIIEYSTTNLSQGNKTVSNSETFDCVINFYNAVRELRAELGLK